MTLIKWTDDLKRGISFQDEDHEEAVSLMNKLQSCSNEDLPALYKSFCEHTVAHLLRENELMDRIGFFAIEVHKGEHDRVIAEMNAFQDKLDAGNLADVRTYVTETLPDWFVNHLNSMDTATAMFARQMGET